MIGDAKQNGHGLRLKQVIKNVFLILSRREKKKLWKIAITDVFVSILDIGFLIALLYLINFYTRPANVTSRKYSFEIFNEHPLLLIASFFVLFSIKNIYGFIVSKEQYHFVYEVASRLSGDKLKQYLNGTFTDYVNVDSSVTNRKISQQPVEFSHYVLNGLQQLFGEMILITITIGAVIIFNPLLFPLLVGILTPPVLLISSLMKRQLNITRQQGKITSEKAMQHLQEALSGYVESNIYQKNDYFTRRYHRFQSRLNQYLSDRLAIQSMPPRLMEVFAVFGLFILVLVNSWTEHGNSIQLVTIGALMVAAYKIIPGIVKITNMLGQVKTYSFTTTDLIQEKRSFSKNIQLIDPIRTIQFDGIYFSYHDKIILKDFSLQANRYDLIGINGLSGRGKTTLINILLGFLKQDSGEIYINGSAADACLRKNYWGRIAYIKQQPFFLHASILENITLEENDFDEEKMKKVLKTTGLDNLVNSFPGGLNTIITENGKNFSGGQRQRIVLARALYKDFDLLILDEPFNELDESSELEMLKQLKSVAAEGRMILLITHNTEALSFCNKKILMDEKG